MSNRLTFGYPMSMPACLWNRPRLERYADRALGPRLTRSVAAHLSRCAECAGHVERHARLQKLVKSTLPEQLAEPDWTGFWPSIQAGIVREPPPPIRDSWWVPLWKPFWGHPKLALGGTLAAGIILTLSLWPVGDKQNSVAWAGPIVVQDVSTADPGRSVMVYSSPDQALTLIWLFSPEVSSDES